MSFDDFKREFSDLEICNITLDTFDEDESSECAQHITALQLLTSVHVQCERTTQFLLSSSSLSSSFLSLPSSLPSPSSPLFLLS